MHLSSLYAREKSQEDQTALSCQLRRSLEWWCGVLASFIEADPETSERRSVLQRTILTRPHDEPLYVMYRDASLSGLGVTVYEVVGGAARRRWWTNLMLPPGGNDNIAVLEQLAGPFGLVVFPCLHACRLLDFCDNNV